MNTRHLIAATLAALSTTAALADDPTLYTTTASSSVSRSEVKAGLRQALKTHQLVAAGDLAAQSLGQAPSVLARSTVKAEVQTARNRGELQPAGELDVASLQAARSRALPVTTLAAR